MRIQPLCYSFRYNLVAMNKTGDWIDNEISKMAKEDVVEQERVELSYNRF